MKKYIEILKKSKLFSGMDEYEIVSMLKCLSATKRVFRRGESIYIAGDVITRVAMVLEGSVYIEREDYWGNNSILSDITIGVSQLVKMKSFKSIQFLSNLPANNS